MDETSISTFLNFFFQDPREGKELTPTHPPNGLGKKDFGRLGGIFESWKTLVASRQKN